MQLESSNRNGLNMSTFWAPLSRALGVVGAMVFGIGAAEAVPQNTVVPDAKDILEYFRTYCLDTENDAHRILSLAGENNLSAVYEPDLRKWSQGIRPHDASGFLLSAEPYVVLEVSLQGTVSGKHRQMLKAGLMVTSDQVAADRPMEDLLDLVPDNVIGLKGCAVHSVGARLPASAAVSELLYLGTPLGYADYTRAVVFDFPAGPVRAIVASWPLENAVVNFAFGHDSAGTPFARLSTSVSVFADDDPGSYRIPAPNP